MTSASSISISLRKSICINFGSKIEIYIDIFLICTIFALSLQKFIN